MKHLKNQEHTFVKKKTKTEKPCTAMTHDISCAFNIHWLKTKQIKKKETEREAKRYCMGFEFNTITQMYHIIE